jgi:hypothetical protein
MAAKVRRRESLVPLSASTAVSTVLHFWSGGTHVHGYYQVGRRLFQIPIGVHFYLFRSDVQRR